MPLRAASPDGSTFTSSAIVTSARHPSGVAYLAGWRKGASLRVGALDLASGKPPFPVVDLGAWRDVWQFAARPEGVLVAGLKTASPRVLNRAEVSLVVLDPSTGRVRWESRHRLDARIPARIYPDGVLAATTTGQPALLDWTTGSPQWTIRETATEPGHLYNTLPAVTWVAPRLTAPLATAADLDTSTPDDPRLAVRSGGQPWILDTRTGDWTQLTSAWAPHPNSTVTETLIIGGSVYLSATFGRSGEALYRFPRRSAATGRKRRLTVVRARVDRGHRAVRIGAPVPDGGPIPYRTTDGPRRHPIRSEAAFAGDRADGRLRHR
jgi:hypothetical protein